MVLTSNYILFPHYTLLVWSHGTCHMIPVVELQSEGRTQVLISSLTTLPRGHSHPFSWHDSGQPVNCKEFMLAHVTTHDVAQSTRT